MKSRKFYIITPDLNFCGSEAAVQPVCSSRLHCNPCQRWHTLQSSAFNLLFPGVRIWHKFRQNWVTMGPEKQWHLQINPTCTQHSWESFLVTGSRKRKGRLRRKWLKCIRSSSLMCWLPLKLKYYH